MKSREIEGWSLRIIESVGAGRPNEDFLVELKATWPDNPNKAARQIAGHANAARGEAILWLIGVDQKKGVVGATFEELAEWWPRVQAEFDGNSPSFWELNISVNALTVVALVFETDRAPFVVLRNVAFGQVGGGSVSLEVPWREGATTRSARRHDLALLLFPLMKVPYAEIISASLTVTKVLNMITTDFEHRWSLDFKMFVEVPIGQRLSILDNRLSGSFELQGEAIHEDLVDWKITGVTGQNVVVLENGVSIDAPNIIRVSASTKTPERSEYATMVKINVKVLPIAVESPIPLDVVLSRVNPIPNSVFMWTLAGANPPWEKRTLPAFI